MKFEQAKDILERAMSFHRMIGNYYQNCLETTKNQRLKMLLTYLIEHENQLLVGLEDYSKKAPKKVLDAWLQFSTCSEKFDELKEKLTEFNPSVEAVQDLTMNLYNCIVTQFESLSKTTEGEDVKTIFLNIAAKEKKEQKKLARNFQQMNEL